jgi:hypothetical protein
VLGSILVTSILKTPEVKDINGNGTFIDYENLCGANNCPSFQLPMSSSKPSVQSVYALCASLIGLCILALIITLVFMDNTLKTSSENTISRQNDLEKTDRQDSDCLEQKKTTIKYISRLSMKHIILL